MQVLGTQIFTDWKVSDHMRAWRMAHRKKRIQLGEVLILPDANQAFVVSGFKFFKKPGGKKHSVSIVWQSQCAVCDEPFTFHKPQTTRSLVRTCPGHRGQWRTAPRPKAKRPPYKPEAPLRDLVLDLMADCACVHNSMLLADFYKLCVEHIEPPDTGQRDTRKQRVARIVERVGVVTGDLIIFAS